MKSIKVLHVTFDMTIGGAQQVIRQLVENMEPSKVISEIACIDNQLGELGELLIKQGIEVHLFNRQQGFDTMLIKQLHRLIKKNKYNIIHCHQYSPYIYGLLASIFTFAKVVFTEHGRFYPDYGTWKRQLVNPLFSALTYKITSISRATKAALVEYENFKEQKIEVLYNGIKDNSHIDVDKGILKRDFKIPEKAFIFGTISRLQPIKNQTMMIRAFGQIAEQHHNVHLLIVGDGERKKELEALVTILNIDNSVTFTGFQNDPYRFHDIIDVFLLSSFSEGASMTLLEAMSFSKPCVVTDVGGNPELIEDKVNGYVVSNDDLNAFAQASLKLFENSDLLKQFGLKGRELFEKKYLVDTMIKSFYKIYSDASK